LIEVGGVVGIGLGAGVHHYFDPVGLEEVEEVVGRMIGVADGLDGGGHRRKKKINTEYTGAVAERQRRKPTGGFM
jgi:hypothetical protein